MKPEPAGRTPRLPSRGLFPQISFLRANIPFRGRLVREKERTVTMAKSHGWRPLTPHRCGKCKDQLVEEELQENRDQGRYGKDLRCWNCQKKEKK